MANMGLEHIYSHSRFGDFNYDKKEDCDWVIEAPETKRVRLRFVTFEVEHESDCSYDYVEVYDGYEDSAPNLGRYCGNKVSVDKFCPKTNFSWNFCQPTDPSGLPIVGRVITASIPFGRYDP